MTRDDRLMAIVLMLRAHRRITASQLAQMFRVTERTIYRDMQTLTESEIPIAASPGIEGGYELRGGYYVPPVMFTKDEAIALFVGGSFIADRKGTPFKEGIGSALSKLESFLPDTTRQPAVITRDNVWWDITDQVTNGPTRTHSEHLRLLTEAIQQQQCVHIRYESEGVITNRVVAPYGVVYSEGKWYFVGYCYLRKALRMFRVDRIGEASLDPQSFERPDDFDISAFTGRQWARSLEERLREVAPSVTIRVPPRILEEIDRHWLYRHSRREPIPNTDDMLVTIHDDDPVAVIRLVRAWGPEVEVIAPRSARDWLRAEGEALTGQYLAEPSVAV